MNFARTLRSRKIFSPPIALDGPCPDRAKATSDDSTADSLKSPPVRDNVILRVRKLGEGRIINRWLILSAILGAAIAFADGLNRGPILERQESWNGPLEYAPYPGTFVLAGITFLLMLAYVRKARISTSEGLFLWFVLCTAAYSRDFSYIRLPGTPLFVTDVVLVILLALTCLFARRAGHGVTLSVNWLIVLLLAVGTLSAARGLVERRETILVLRDAALVIYPLFLYVGHNMIRNWLGIRRVVTWFLLGTALSVVNGFGWFLSAPQERRFIYYGPYVLIALVGTFVAMANRLVSTRKGWSLAGLFLLGLALADARSLFVVLPILIAIGLCGGGLLHRKVRRTRLVATTLAATVLISGMVFLFLRTDAGRDFVERSAEGVDSGVFHPAEDTNWQFRMSAWREAWRRFEEYPLAGEGYGIPFVFDLLMFDNDSRPHNTFLTVLYKMGLIGILPLLALIAYFFWNTLHALHRNLQSRRAAFLWIVALAQIAFCFYGAANLLLESPFLASLFWVLMGLGFRMSRMLDLERTLLRSA